MNLFRIEYRVQMGGSSVVLRTGIRSGLVKMLDKVLHSDKGFVFRRVGL